MSKIKHAHAHISASRTRNGYIGHADIVRNGLKLGSLEHGNYKTVEEAKNEIQKLAHKLIKDLSS